MSQSLYRQIAQQIEDKIKAGELNIYDKLPSERYMSANYGVSRNVIRESLKLLNEKGIVEIRKGQGCYITKPGKEEITERVKDAIIYNDFSLNEILDVRKSLELSSCENIVKNCTLENIQNLKKYYSAMNKSFSDSMEYARNDFLFHLELIDCSKNRLSKLLVNAINDVSDEELYKIKRTHSSLNISQRHHKEMVKAIEKSDVQKLYEVMTKHFEALGNDIKGL